MSFVCVTFLHVLTGRKSGSGFLTTDVTGVTTHGQDVKFVLLKSPADTNATANMLLTVFKYLKEKVNIHDIHTIHMYDTYFLTMHKYI